MWQTWLTIARVCAFVLVSLAFAGGSSDSPTDLSQSTLPKVADPEIAALLQQLQDKAHAVAERIERIEERQAAQPTPPPAPPPPAEKKRKPTRTPAPTQTPLPEPTATPEPTPKHGGLLDKVFQ